MCDDCHCWDLAAVEEEVVEMTYCSLAMTWESQETLDLVDQERIGPVENKYYFLQGHLVGLQGEVGSSWH